MTHRPIETPDDIKTSVRILGEQQVLMFDSMCAANGRRPHQMAADIVLEAIQDAWLNPDLADIARLCRRYRSGLYVVGAVNE